MFNKEYSEQKVTFRDLGERINSLRNWDLKNIEDDIKNLTQLVSMLLEDLGYGATMRRGEAVTLTKSKKK